LGPIRLSATPIEDRLIFFQYYLACTVLTVLPIAADLNARRKLHRQVKRSEAEFRMLAEHCTDVIMRSRRRPHHLRLAVGVLLTGYLPAALVGRSSRTIIDPRDLDKVIGQHHATLAARGEPRSYDYRAITIDGTTRWFSTLPAPCSTMTANRSNCWRSFATLATSRQTNSNGRGRADRCVDRTFPIAGRCNNKWPAFRAAIIAWLCSTSTASRK
jgi:PAS domain S-box-containing protein